MVNTTTINVYRSNLRYHLEKKNNLNMNMKLKSYRPYKKAHLVVTQDARKKQSIMEQRRFEQDERQLD